MDLFKIGGRRLRKTVAYLFLLLFGTICCFTEPKNNSCDSSVWFSIFNDRCFAQSVKNTKGMEVHFLNVGNADCSYIKCGKVNILIDAGARTPKGFVANYLKKKGVKKLNLVVATHPHADHIGQMADVLEKFKVDKFIEPKMPNSIIPTTVTYEKMLKALKKHKVKAETVKAGRKFSIGDLKIEVVGPVSQGGKSYNNYSIVLRITYKNVKFLFTGDAEKKEESDILSGGSQIVGKNKGYKVKADVLKVGHHGSKTSTTDKFLKAVSPKYAIISVSKKKYKSVKSTIEKKLKKYCGKRIYVTGNSGNIVCSTDGKKIKIKKGA